MPALHDNRVTDLEALAKIERQTALRVNERTHHQRGPGFKTGWGISPALARASVAREKPPAKPAEPKLAPAATPAVVPPPAIKIEGRVLARFADYDGLWGAVRKRVDELGITREALDYLSGNQPGYSGKILGPKQIRKLGFASLGNTLGATGTYLVLVEDPEQTAKMMARCKKRQRPLRPATPDRSARK